jgi:epoxyqueuosine reductase
MKIEKAIETWSKKRGYRYAVGNVGVLEEVRTTLKRRRDAGEIEANFFRDNLEVLSYLEGCPLQNPRSIVIVAIPLPAYVLRFSVGGREVDTLLPPTYVRYRKIFEEVRDDLRQAVSGYGCRLELLNAPLKAIGNRLGLLSYGRNNVGYIDGVGSYFQLVGLVTDKRIGPKRGPVTAAEALLPRCPDCLLCARACPMGAIDKDRILIHAEKCYTLFSESPRPIPDGMKPPSPKCLVGCLRCQQVCPENKGLLRFEEAAVSFDAEETAAFLGVSEAPARARDKVRRKFLKLGLTEAFPVYTRNLERMLSYRRIAIPGK